MSTVVVDTDDLEALLFATSGIKDIEAAIQQRKTNPMVKSGMGRLAGAHDRLAAAWRRSKREVEWPAKLVTKEDVAALRAMFTKADGEVAEVVVSSDYPSYFAQRLMLVESGPLWYGYQVEWPSPSEPEFVKSAVGGVSEISYGIRLNHYGRQVLAAATTAISQDKGSTAPVPTAFLEAPTE